MQVIENYVVMLWKSIVIKSFSFHETNHVHIFFLFNLVTPGTQFGSVSVSNENLLRYCRKYKECTNRFENTDNSFIFI